MLRVDSYSLITSSNDTCGRLRSRLRSCLQIRPRSRLRSRLHSRLKVAPTVLALATIVPPGAISAFVPVVATNTVKSPVIVDLDAFTTEGNFLLRSRSAYNILLRRGVNEVFTEKFGL